MIHTLASEKHFDSAGWEVVSLDSDPKTDATSHEDIWPWGCTTLPSGDFDALGPAPPVRRNLQKFHFGRGSAQRPAVYEGFAVYRRRLLQLLRPGFPRTDQILEQR